MTSLELELLEACKALSDYVHLEQSSNDGAVQYSTTQINRIAFTARAAIARAESAVSEPVNEYDIRGILASKLACWHRLTGKEAQELVDLFSTPPAAVPLTSKQIHAIEREVAISQLHNYPTDAEAFARAIEKAHGIGEKQ